MHAKYEHAMDASALNELKMRPVYHWVISGSPEEFVQRLCQLVSFDPAVRIQCGSRHAVLRIPDEARHTWSPTLDIQVRASARGSHVRARLGPEPQIWTLFIFLYGATAFPGLIASMYGLSQLAMGQAASALWGLPISAVAWGLIYLASFFGKGLGARQTHQLMAAVEACLEAEAEQVEAAP